MADHVVSVIRDEERPYVAEIWCSCTRFGSVAEVRRAWYRYAVACGDDDEVWVDDYDQALGVALRGHPGWEFAARFGRL